MLLNFFFKSFNLFWYDSIHSYQKQANDVLIDLNYMRKFAKLLLKN